MSFKNEISQSPFEGPEKLLEIWFAPSVAHLPNAALASSDGKFGLRRVPRPVWEEMLAIVKCKILSVLEGTDMDAYLLSESSFFVSPHRLILKTCGTTLNLLGLPRILEIARTHASLQSVYRCFYSRKTFMFPERQLGPHRDWNEEIKFLDNLFPNGAAYTVGKVNGDHWLLYLTSPDEMYTTPKTPLTPMICLQRGNEILHNMVHPTPAKQVPVHDYTIEILMSDLALEARQPFLSFPELETSATPSTYAQILSSNLGISDVFPSHLTTLDAYIFSPCGYSANALVKWGDPLDDDGDVRLPHRCREGYYNIHVTPENDWSYASFECNVPLPTRPSAQAESVPDLRTLIHRVVSIFQPGKLSLTLFISSEDNGNTEEEEGSTAVEAAQRAFKAALTVPLCHAMGTMEGPYVSANTRGKIYRRTDKINYEFGGYGLAFASFDICS